MVKQWPDKIARIGLPGRTGADSPKVRRAGAVIRPILAGLCLLLTSGISFGEWVRFFAGRPSDYPGIPFGLLSTADDSDHGLSASGWYRYVEGRDPVTLRGKNGPEGNFQPIVTYEVATEGKVKWKTIDADCKQQPGSDSITVDPEHPGTAVSISMEPFRRSIGVYRYGRLVLENGDATVFELDNLLPTTDESDRGEGDFKVEITQSDEEKKKAGFTDGWLGQPADLIAVTSVGGRVIGDFVFNNRSGSAAILQGGKTLDGDFWPKVTFQIANSDGHWKDLGTSRHSGQSTTLQISSGRAERVRVILTDYKPVMDKFKYGRVVFSNGQAGIFSINNLKTH